jgi:hypothetical protein
MHDTESFDDSGALKPDGPLARLLQDAAEYSGLSNLGKEEWWSDTTTAVANALLYVNSNRRAQEGQEVEFTTADNQTISGVSDAEGNITTADGTTYSGVH